jgi:hypothetical protein
LGATLSKRADAGTVPEAERRELLTLKEISVYKLGLLI